MSLPRSFIALAALALCAPACEKAASNVGDDTSAGDADGDADAASDTDTDTDSDTDTGTEYTGPVIPETCEQAAQATTTVGCLFYAADLDTVDSVETTNQYAIAVSNVNETKTANVQVFRGKAGVGWVQVKSAALEPMTLQSFSLADLHQSGSGFLEKGSFKVVSDVPIIAYQFNPVDGAYSFLSDASMLIPVTSLSLTYDIMGWKRTADITGGADGTMRAYFTVVATADGTVVTITPSVAPLAGGPVQATTTPFIVSLDEGDVVEVATNNVDDSLTGSHVTSNEGHPIVVFSGQECAYIPKTTCCCDHLEEQLPGVRFWGKEFVAARMPLRSTGAVTDVLWQIYASEDGTTVQFQASTEVTGLPASPTTLNKGQNIQFFAAGTPANPGDFAVTADKPIGIMQYMTGAQVKNSNGLGDPAMVWTSPTEQFLPRYVVLVPTTWVSDMLIITRKAGSAVLLDGAPVPDSEFVAVGTIGYEVARHVTPDGVHTLASANGTDELGVIVVGWDQYDSYAYMGGMSLGAINPSVV